MPKKRNTKGNNEASEFFLSLDIMHIGLKPTDFKKTTSNPIEDGSLISEPYPKRTKVEIQLDWIGYCNRFRFF